MLTELIYFDVAEVFGAFSAASQQDCSDALWNPGRHFFLAQWVPEGRFRGLLISDC